MRYVIHTMPGCELCVKCKKLLDHWDIKYDVIEDNPIKDEEYPIIYVDDEKISFKELVKRIALDL